MDTTNTETQAPVITLIRGGNQGSKAPHQRPGHHGRRAPPRREGWWLFRVELYDQLRRKDRPIRSSVRFRRRQSDRRCQERDLSPRHAAGLSKRSHGRQFQVRQSEREQDLWLRRVVLGITRPPTEDIHAGMARRHACFVRARLEWTIAIAQTLANCRWPGACAGTANLKWPENISVNVV